MRIIFLMIGALLLIFNILHGQATFFDFSYSTGETYTPISGGTQIFGPGTDSEITDTPIPIGFTFLPEKVEIDEVKVSSNGFITVDLSITQPRQTNRLSSRTFNGVVAPFWDALDVRSDGEIVYQLSGSPGNQVFSVEFKNMSFDSDPDAVMNFMVKVYEGSNHVEFWYGDMGVWTGQSASIGINSIFEFNFLALVDNSDGTYGITNIVDNLITESTYIQNGLKITFTPRDNWHGWTGINTNGWNDPDNWDKGSVPGSTDYVTISGGKDNYPVLTSSLQCGNLSLREGGSITVNTSGILEVDTNIFLKGTLEIQGGEVRTNHGDFCTTSGTIFSITSGNLNIADDWSLWTVDNSRLGAFGTLDLNGGTITIEDDCSFTEIPQSLNASIEDGCEIVIKDDLRIHGLNWAFNGGNFRLTGEKVEQTVTIDCQNPDFFNCGVGNLILDVPGNVEVDLSRSGNMSIEGDLTINENVEIKTVSSNENDTIGSLDVDGSILFETGAILNCFKPITIAGDWTNNGGTFNGENGTVTFNGNEEQFINGSQPTLFFDVLIDNSAGVFVDVETNITNSLILMNNASFKLNGTNDVNVGGN